MQASNPSTQEAKAGGCLCCAFEASLFYKVILGQPGLSHRETPVLKTKQIITNEKENKIESHKLAGYDGTPIIQYLRKEVKMAGKRVQG